MKSIPVAIVLVRHGQTAWNKDERFRGRADLPLNEYGISQANATARRLSNCGATAIWASPLQRTLMTAEPIAAQLGLKIEPLQGLIDIDYGAWQGLSTEEALENDPDLYQKWVDTPQDASFPGGESLRDVRNRVGGVIEDILRERADRTTILVSHVVVCRVFVCAVLGLDNSHFWQIGQDTCAVNCIGLRDGKLVLNSLNDTCHLKGPGE